MNDDKLLIAIKEMFDNKIDEFKHYVGVMNEDLRKDIKAIAEGHGVLNDKMDRLEDRFDKMENKVDKLEMKVDNLETKVDNLDNKVENVKKELKAEMKIVQDYVINVDKKLNEHEVILKRVK